MIRRIKPRNPSPSLSSLVLPKLDPIKKNNTKNSNIKVTSIAIPLDNT
jgi:hypothetical protein